MFRRQIFIKCLSVPGTVLDHEKTAVSKIVTWVLYTPLWQKAVIRGSPASKGEKMTTNLSQYYQDEF